MPDCPHCGQALTVAHLRAIVRALPARNRRKLGGMLLQSTQKHGAGGRPRLDVPRCACGLYTAETAAKRKHVCANSAVT